jgi:tetratricopeptide (TPR) repeat protein
MNRIRKAVLIGFLLTASIASGVLLIRPASRNHAFHQALETILAQPANLDQAISQLNPEIDIDCRVNWQIITLASGMDTPLNVEDYIDKLLACTPNSVDWLLMLYPEREDLAARAAQRYPEEPKAWFWLGDLANNAGDLVSAKKYFTESVSLDPTYALAWCRLGRINENQGVLDDAEESFWQCCANGDPGSNGCYGAGRMAEKLDDIPAAIQYYRRSHWQPALQRADALEASQ